MDILLDASVIMAIILDEPNKNVAIKLTKGSTLLSPAMISYDKRRSNNNKEGWK
jgi:hypothetical protein